MLNFDANDKYDIVEYKNYGLKKDSIFGIPIIKGKKLGLTFYYTSQKEVVQIYNLKTKEVNEHIATKSDLIVVDGQFIIIGNGDYYHPVNYLEWLYRNTYYRYKLMQTLKKSFLRALVAWKDDIEEFVLLQKNIGFGCYGSVFSGLIENYQVAVKYASLSEDAIKNPDLRLYGWNELTILKNIFKPLIKLGKTQNVPLLYDYFLTDKVKLDCIKPEKKSDKCIVLITELASSNLKEFLQSSTLNVDELNCIFFQLMVSIHTIQKHGQIMNFDIKAENILVYKIKVGGYWKYTILDQDYYIPNYGFIIVINDFGLSRSMDIRHIMLKSRDEKFFRIGKRCGLIKDGCMWPVNCVGIKNNVKWNDGSESSCCDYVMDVITKKTDTIDLSPEQELYIRSLGMEHNEELYLKPELFPPLEFFNDIQDGIRMFVGGKRTTQKGYHRSYKHPRTFTSKIKMYEHDDEINYPLESYYYSAGQFINHFFDSIFRKKIVGVKMLQHFTV